MSRQDRRSEEIAALERLLEAYGADRTRWPPRERLRFASLLASEPEAQRHVAEAAALDRLLDLAPTASTARERAVSERIMGAAQMQQRAPHRASQATPASSNIVSLPAWARQLQIGRAFSLNEWPAAGLLVASLVLGVMLGSTGTLESTMQEVAEVAGLSSNITGNAQFTLGEDAVAWAGEELL